MGQPLLPAERRRTARPGRPAALPEPRPRRPAPAGGARDAAGRRPRHRGRAARDRRRPRRLQRRRARPRRPGQPGRGAELAPPRRGRPRGRGGRATVPRAVDPVRVPAGPLLHRRAEPPRHAAVVLRPLRGAPAAAAERRADAPTRLEDVAGWEIEEQHLQLHDIRPGKTGPPGNAGNRPIFHGQGGGNDDREVDVEKFIRAVAAAVDEAIPHPDAPVVLACDPAVEPFFRRCTRLSDVVEPALRGNHEHSDDTAVHAAAWSVVASRFEAIERATRARFADLRGTGRTAERIEEVVPAACGGRVDTLFVREGARVRGIFDPDAWRARRTEDELATDLANLAATDTYLNRGRVLVVPPERMPTEAAVAAILRY
ncbi:MAG TPA: hypothetical protein RMH99_07820 [Sandaracinaceae bacterium LLY-WYZ-13_1]|nr:hypothetical protein [Sandaracinaceae bacterium LLY-WYZ-13_1]